MPVIRCTVNTVSCFSINVFDFFALVSINDQVARFFTHITCRDEIFIIMYAKNSNVRRRKTLNAYESSLVKFLGLIDACDTGNDCKCARNIENYY